MKQQDSAGMRSNGLFRIALVVGIAFSLILATLPSGSAAQSSVKTRVQFLHAGTDVGKVEVFINGDEALDEFAYGDTSDQLDVDPGTTRLTISQDRTGFNYVIFDSVYPVEAGVDYYVIITDSIVITGAFEQSIPARADSVVKVTQASIDTPAIDVRGAAESGFAITTLAYPFSSEPVGVKAGAANLELGLDSTGETLLTQDLTIEAGKSYNIVLIGTPGNAEHPLTAVVLETTLDGSATPKATPVS